jgi:predicted ATPase
MTFLLTDIEASTRQWEESTDMQGLVEQHFAALFDSVEAASGEVFATMGDGVAAAFPSAESAVRAAIAAQRQMAQIGLGVRMGIHTGEVVRVGGDFRGRPVNRAARIMAVGNSGQIVVSDVVAALVRGGPSPVDLLDLGTHQLRDLTEPERLWQVVHTDLERSFPPVRGLDTYANNLPTQRSSLVGRDLDVARVVEMLEHHRIVTLTGVGGVGKTRLALQAAADLLSHFSGVWFVELAKVTDPRDVADTVAVSLGIGAVADPLTAACAMLMRESTLLVVDNCEHVVDSAAGLIDTLTAKCPQLSVIATSREALGIEGEHVHAVGSLEPGTTADELFLQRAASTGADTETMDRDLVEHICTRIDGLPLAIELAAARASTLGLPAIVDALDDRFNLLSGGRRRALDRHATMKATIEWSYRLLDAGERRLLQWLSVFPNGFEIDAATHMAGALGIDAPDVAEHVASLVQKSMIVAESSAHGMRYRLLETMRDFSLERIDEEGERLVALTALAEWVTTITDLPFDDPCSAAVERHAIRLEREADAWRDAVTVAARVRSGDLAARLCGPPVAFFLVGRHDLADFVRPLVELCDDGFRRRRAVLCALSVSAAGATDPVTLQGWADEMRAIDEVEPTGIGAILQWLAFLWRGDFASSVEVCTAASNDRRIRQATRDFFVGIATLDRFSLTEASNDPDGLIERALEVAGRSDVALHRVTCLLGAAWGLAAVEPTRALELVRQALTDIDDLPALTRVTLPGSASRLLARLDPQVAARGLLEQLDSRPQRESFIDLIPLSYATALLQRVDHPAADSVLEIMSVATIAPQRSMMDFVDLARQTTAAGNLVALNDLEESIRRVLTDIANGAGTEQLC